ncbi:Flavin-binding monooxygenase-like protein [Rubripirellula obstinata]|uniref:Flavin-binding monooxygenase-like protein n=1 Tax=Rubripirellula obstinata TaxID=406547 RepID=A0A5B1CL70_9BACT|nr:SidA/IucD/PvdA family monooxygenase [Rubripirellula obstinata]KAA1260074.1 Flavin-binding monooxygenase-like protein [Rubripirellula obstinata]
MKRLAIVGTGSSGLIALKNAIEQLSDWEIVCLERSHSIQGCWGNPFEGFKSTSTKYTTQFACFAPYDATAQDATVQNATTQNATVQGNRTATASEFFCDGEYGQYLESFADEFDLRRWISFGCNVSSIVPDQSKLGWQLKWSVDGNQQEVIKQQFDAVILCTGLASVPKTIESSTRMISPAKLNENGGIQSIKHQRIVVFGGGESAVDYARRLAEPSQQNQVYLSLRSGIRVSPRYHPIRGVPSDFLRNRLLLSIHRDIRNWIGGGFVKARIRYQSLFEKLFTPKHEQSKSHGGTHQDSSGSSGTMLNQVPSLAKSFVAGPARVQSGTANDGLNPGGPSYGKTGKLFRGSSLADSSWKSRRKQSRRKRRRKRRRKHWATRLNEAAKDQLFDMFHNKSDDFLDAVANGDLEIVGSPTDETANVFRAFGDRTGEDLVQVNPDLIVPAIGYRSTLDELSNGTIRIGDFYLGCVHVEHPNLFLVGFARPVIGNIPTISEMQSRYVVGLIAGLHQRPADIATLHQNEIEALSNRFKTLDLDAIYPVEMFPYCDELAKMMGTMPKPRLGGLWRWWKQQLTPATTRYYPHSGSNQLCTVDDQSIYLPASLIALLLLLKPIDWAYRVYRKLRNHFYGR